MFCTGCGTPIQPQDHFCHHCGKELHPLEQGQPPHRKRTAPWVIVTGILFLLFSFYFTWSTVSYSNLEQPVRAQLESLKQGKIPEAYYEYTSHQFQAATSLEAFRNFVNNYPPFKDNKSATFEAPIINENLGILKGILYSNNGEKLNVQYMLQRQDEEWKIVNIQLNPPQESQQLTAQEEEALYQPIKYQLTQIKEGHPKDAYEQVAPGFKAATNYDQFQTFIERLPIFKQDFKQTFKDKVVQEDKAAVRVEITDGKQTIPLEYHLVKDNNQWKIWSLQLIETPTNTPDISLMVEPIQNQLKSLKDKEFQKAYDENVSNEFKKVTPFSTFEAFMQRFTIFTDYTSVDYKQPHLEDSGGKVIIVLHDEQGGSATVEYTLGVEDGKWKIWGFKLTQYNKNDQDKKNKELSPEQLEKVAKDQLEAIHTNNLDKAYTDYTATPFKEATSLDVFKKFIQNYPIFTNYKTVTFSNMTVNNNVATIRGEFIDPNGLKVPIEYDFIPENDQWKILRVQILTQEMTQPQTYFPKIVLGNEVDAEGAVVDEKTEITDTTKPIYANIFVNGKKGDIVTVIFKHLDTNSAITPISSTPIPQDGVYRTSFSFSPPPNGWPKGKYALDITSSAGNSETYNFEVK